MIRKYYLTAHFSKCTAGARPGSCFVCCTGSISVWSSFDTILRALSWEKRVGCCQTRFFFSPPLPFFFHLELNCQQGEKLYFSVWRVTFYAQFLHTAQRCWYSWCDLVVPCPWCWISFVQRIEKVSARHSARLCAVLCCAAFAVCYFLQWELFLCIWGWI